MKTLSLLILLSVIWLPSQALAQFPFPGGGGGGKLLPNLGKQLQHQIRREVQQHAGRIVNEIDRAIGGGLPMPAPTPYPRPLPQPVPVPLPHPQPTPDLGPINKFPVTQPPCRIVPQPTPKPQPEPEPEPNPEPLPQVESGQVVTLEDGSFGEEVGSVLVRIESLVMTAELLDWSNESVEARLPQIPMATSAEAIVAVVNAQGEIAQAISVELMPPSDPAEGGVTEEELPVVYAGQEVAVEGQLGEEPGTIQLHIGQLVLNATVVQWSAEETTVQIPKFGFDEPVVGTLVVTRADGEQAEELAVQFHPAVAGEQVADTDR